MTKSATRVAADEVSAPIASPSFTGNVGINETSPAANIHLGASSPHIDIGPSGANRGKIGFNSNNVYIGSTSGAGEIHFKNNISSNDEPNSSGDTKMIIADSAVIIGNGVTLGNGTTYAAANTLDDYEEGTWTPVIQNTTGTFIASEAFNYVKVGKVVTTRGYIYNGSVASASAIWQFGGLPFQPLREAYGVVQFYVVNIPGDSAWVNVYANPTSSYIRLIATRDAGTSDSLQWSDVGTGHVDFHLTYLTT